MIDGERQQSWSMTGSISSHIPHPRRRTSCSSAGRFASRLQVVCKSFASRLQVVYTPGDYCTAPLYSQYLHRYYFSTPLYDPTTLIYRPSTFLPPYSFAVLLILLLHGGSSAFSTRATLEPRPRVRMNRSAFTLHVPGSPPACRPLRAARSAVL